MFISRTTRIALPATTAPPRLGLKTPPHVPVTGVQCSNCHTNTAPSFVTYTMTHSAVSAARCNSCHNGSYTAEGTKGAQGTASYPNHVAPAGRDCIVCHASAAVSFTSWAGATYLHQPTDTNCSSCHNGTNALGLTTPPHVPVTGVQCGNCHTNTATSFVTYTMTHSAVSASRCDSCHNGSYTSEGTKGALGTASYAGHVATTGRDCITCHASAATTFTSWSGGRLCPSAERHQLLVLPQRHDGDRQHHAAAHSGDRRPVQQLPHQYGNKLCDLHDDALGGERQPLRLLPQRFVYLARHERRAWHGVVCGSRCDRRSGLHHLPRGRGHDLHQLVGRDLRPSSRPTPIARAATTARRQPAIQRRRTFR